MAFPEKHRPTTFAEIVGQPIDKIRPLLNGRQTPNFLLYGPPGTGKSTTARLIAEEVSNGEYVWFNSSDARGINDVTTDVQRASRMSLSGGTPVVVLDEADGFTPEAQNALRHPMENNPGVFVLTANRVGQIHRAVQSRCHANGIEFSELDADSIARRLGQVAGTENINIGWTEIEEIAKKSNGDMRAALSKLESHHRTTTRGQFV
jgi:DNA polymerase III delta prime subunit